MNADLDETLAELGPEYRAVVSRMTSAFDDAPQVRRGTRLPFLGRRAALLAAMLLVCLAGAWLFPRAAAPAAATVPRSPYVLAYSPDAANLAALVRTQHADGSWDNDFLTRQNAAALRAASADEARIAYRRAVRYLRAKGLSPLSEAELRARGALAARLPVRG